MKMDRGRLDKIMAEAGMDAIVAITPENVLYTTGAYIMTQKSIRDRLAISVFAGNSEPVFIVCGIEEEGARSDSWIKDIRTYVEFQESPIDYLVQVIKEKKLEDKKVGMEFRYLTRHYNDQLVSALPQTSFVEAREAFDRLRMIKSPEEIAILKKAARVTVKAGEVAFSGAHPGDTEKSLANAMLHYMIDHGADEIAFMVLGAGPRTPIAHPTPGGYVLKEGDIARVDYGGLFEGYYSDIARTVSVGKPSAKSVDSYKKLANIQQEVIMSMKAGTRVCDAFNLCKRRFEEEKIPFGMPHIGHGLGVDLHEEPMINPLNRSLFEPNMVFCVEPLTNDGSNKFHVEDLIVITESGAPEILSRDTFTDELFVIS